MVNTSKSVCFVILQLEWSTLFRESEKSSWAQVSGWHWGHNVFPHAWPVVVGHVLGMTSTEGSSGRSQLEGMIFEKCCNYSSLGSSVGGLLIRRRRVQASQDDPCFLLRRLRQCLWLFMVSETRSPLWSVMMLLGGRGRKVDGDTGRGRKVLVVVRKPIASNNNARCLRQMCASVTLFHAWPYKRDVLQD